MGCFVGGMKSYTREEVGTHCSYDDAWIIVDDKVYDVSDWAYKHPGGRVLLYYRGQDATEPVKGFHPDMKKTEKYMKALCVGTLSNEPPPPVIEDFRKLKQEFENEGKFEPSFMFYLLHFLQLVVLEAAGIATMYYTGSFVLTAALMATSQIQAGWLQHDFGHCAVFKSAYLNQMFHYFFIGSCKGAVSWWWKSRHNRHHAKTNMIKLDPDMHTEPLFSFSEDLATKPKWKPLRRFVPFLPYQKYYWFLFGPPAVTTFLFLWEITVFMAKRGRPADILAVYLFFLRFDLVFTALGLSPFQAIGLYFLMRLIESHWFTWVTSMSHLPMPIMEDQRDDWVTLQLRGTLNTTTGTVEDWFTGYLNYQIEHHLFPNMPRHHYPAVAPRVKELCRKHGVPYHQTGIWDSFVRVLDKLEAVAKKYSAALSTKDY